MLPLALTRWLAAWPGLCPVCGQWASHARCPACTARFATPRRRCLRCAAHLAEATPQGANTAALTIAPAFSCLCPECLADPPPQAATIAAVDYTFPWSTLLPQLKFHAHLGHAPWLAALLADAVRAAPACATAGPVELVTAVPLSDARLCERGFNQAAQIARPLARDLALPLDETLLLRWRSTGAQSALQRRERLRNLGSAFMPHPLARPRLHGRHVALVDDVLTTGATLRAATAALLEGGARAVSLWVVARTPSPRELEAMQLAALTRTDPACTRPT